MNSSQIEELKRRLSLCEQENKNVHAENLKLEKENETLAWLAHHRLQMILKLKKMGGLIK